MAREDAGSQVSSSLKEIEFLKEVEGSKKLGGKVIYCAPVYS